MASWGWGRRRRRSTPRSRSRAKTRYRWGWPSGGSSPLRLEGGREWRSTVTGIKTCRHAIQSDSRMLRIPKDVKKVKKNNRPAHSKESIFLRLASSDYVTVLPVRTLVLLWDQYVRNFVTTSLMAHLHISLLSSDCWRLLTPTLIINITFTDIKRKRTSQANPGASALNWPHHICGIKR